MPQTITTGYKALCDAAEREIETIPAEEAVKRWFSLRSESVSN